MQDFTYQVTIKAESQNQAELVIAERLDHYDDYGFSYEIDYMEL